jgi:AraC family transcriptional regulator
MEQAVERVVTAMRNRYHERLSIPELAAETYFSPFHFIRIFRRETGVTPCHYLTAVRLFEAKRLLVTTSLNVADVACRVGYPGVGTFTTRFTRLVGVSPGHYRRLPAEEMLSVAGDACRLPDPDLVQLRATAGGGAVLGSVHFGSFMVDRVLVGVFHDPIPQGPPVAWIQLRGVDGTRWRLDGVPAGRWVLIAVGQGRQEACGRRPAYLGVGKEIPVGAGGGIVRTDLELRRPLRTDAPIMVPLYGELAYQRPTVRLAGA